MKNDNVIRTSNLAEAIEKRIILLEQVLKEANVVVKKLPKGNIYAAKRSNANTYRYYLRENPSDSYGVYLDKSKDKLKTQLSQKKYYLTLINKVNKELKALKRARKEMCEDSIMESYTQLSKGIQKLTIPIAVDDDTYIKMWEAEKYVGLSFDKNDPTEFYSEKDERMRSKSEVLIANMLNKYNIPYKYEKPIMMADGRLVYPDFTILLPKSRKVIYLEHLGKMGDIDYTLKNMKKIDEYREIGINLGVELLVTCETLKHPLGTREIKKIINDILNMDKQ